MPWGGSQAYTITPDAHLHVADVLVDGVSVGPVPGHTFTDVQSPHTIAATFAIDTYQLTYRAGAGGTLSGTSPQTVEHGADGTAVTALPDTGHHFVDWSDGLATPGRTDTNVTADIDVTANFAIDTHEVSFDSHGGTAVAPQTVAFGSLVATPAPDPTRTGHAFAGWYADAALTDPWDFSADTVTGETTLHAKWVADTYTITTAAGAGGTISPASPLVAHGADQSFLIVPDAHFHILDVLVDGVSQGAIGSYTFADVTSAGHTISATFAIDTNDITASAGPAAPSRPPG